jgi:integrase
MSIKLIPPSKKRRTPFFSGRGTYLGVRVDRSTKTDRRVLAKRIIKQWERQIERGEYRTGKEVEAAPQAQSGELTFAMAAVAYMNAGGERRVLGKALDQLGMKPVGAIDQATIDAGAVAAFPRGTAAYRNRNFYTPVSAVLKHVGIERPIKRPKGWRGKRSTAWLEPEQAFAVFKAADRLDREFGLFLRTLCYTGMRLGEAIAIRLRELNLKTQTIYLPETKNDQARPVYLPPVLVAALANHPRELDRSSDERLFRFHIGGRLRAKLKTALAAAGVVLPRRQAGFHVFCHTWGTWMRRYGKLDTFDLVDTERWKDPASARRYAHTEPGEAARRADLLPVEKRRTTRR